MKYEISDLLNDKYKYGLTLLRIHKKINKGIIPLLLMKITVTEERIFYTLFIIISSIPLLILSNDFIPVYNQYYYFSTCLRYLTPLSLVTKLRLTHTVYIIICICIYIICIIRITSELVLLYNIYSCHSTESYKIKESRIIRILNHIVMVFFSYIIEFLSFIYYIELFPNDFIIKKNRKINEIHIIFLILNGIFIVVYNINNYIFITVSNRPSADKKYPLRMLIPTSKFYILVIFQNFGFIHPLQIYLKADIHRIWCILQAVIILLILLWNYFLSVKLYNFDNNINSILSFIGEFCFISIIVEIILFLLSINHHNFGQVIYFILIKLMVSLCLFFFLKTLYQKIMIKIIRISLFYNNPSNRSFDTHMTNSILFLGELFDKKNVRYLTNIYHYIIWHQKECPNYHCGCKIIKMKKMNSKEDDNLFIDELLKKLNYYLESILIHYNFQNNFELSTLLSEHFHLYKNNSIISYSILQTYLHYNYKNLNNEKLCIIYELMNKYVKYTLKQRTNNINMEKYEHNESNINKILKEMELKQYINYLLKIKIANKYMISYSKKYKSIILHKEKYENNIVIKKNEIYNEINYICAPYLNKNILNKLIIFLSEEMRYTSDIQKYLYDLEEYNKILPYEFLYKIFLFSDNFWDGKIPDNLINIFYGFSSNCNLYSSKIKPEIYQILENKYNELFIHTDKKYFLLFKLTKGIKISYISESFTRILHYKQNDLINNDIGLLLIKDLIEPHENIIKHYFIIKQHNVLKDKIKYIFDNNEYMIYSKINAVFQIGINKNILIIATAEMNRKYKEICFYTNSNLNIISINRNFEDNLFLSLRLIKELQIDLKELFGISVNDIRYNYHQETIKAKNIREYKALDTKEYILKNLFNRKYQNNNYYIPNKYIINDNEEESDRDDDNEIKILKEKENKKKILKIFQKLYDNKTSEKFHIAPISYQINKKNYIVNLKKIIEKINFYEQDKLESKNIFDDFLKLSNNFKNFIQKQNEFFNVIIKPKLIYDTTFYSCKIKQNLISNIFEINDNFYKEGEIIQNIKNEKEDSIKNASISIKRDKKLKSIFSTKTYSEDKINNFKSEHENPYYYRDKIKSKKVSQYKLCVFLLFCILVLLISCIITLNYQTSLVHKNDKIFDAIYYNYYQRTQFMYLNSIILSIYYELLNISNQHTLEDNKDVLYMIGKNIESSHQLFIRYYMDFKIELNEDFSRLYEPLIANKITMNWENRIFYNDYNSELALIVYRILDSVKHNFDKNDIRDCENLLLEKYKTIDSKKTPVYGNFIKLVYYFYINYEVALRNYFTNLEKSFDRSLNDFSKQTTLVYFILELLALISFISFFFINIYFLMNSNSYIFRNILYMFIDFTQKKEYSFKNKIFNLFVVNRINNYILLLKDFTPKNLDVFRNDKEIEKIDSLTNLNLNVKFLMDEEEQNTSNKQKVPVKKFKSLVKKGKINKDTSININKVLDNSKNSPKDSQELNHDIHYLNNQNLNLISNNNSISKVYSTHIILNSSNNYSSLINSSLPFESVNTINTSYDFSKKNKTKKSAGEKKGRIFNEKKIKKENENEEFMLTIDKILFKTKITLLISIKVIIIIFIIFTLIFIVYFIYKFIVSLLFISNFRGIITDFKTLTNQYNQISLYWNHMKFLFILPNAPIIYDYNNTEEFFSNMNNDIKIIYKYRMKNFKKLSSLYDILLSSSIEQNSSNIDFCLGHQRCYNIRDSQKNLLSNGIESAVNLYAKEIFNFYKDFLELKNKIKTKDDIIKYFISDKYKILSSNINHVIIYLEELFFRYFLEDEINIVNSFYLRIKILNIIEICYCALLNLFSVLFVYNYITKIVSFVEISSIRINDSLKKMKILK